MKSNKNIIITDINKQEKLAKHASYYGGSSDMSSDDEHKSAILVLSPELASSHLIQQGAKLSKITDKFIENKTTGYIDSLITIDDNSLIN